MSATSADPGHRLLHAGGLIALLGASALCLWLAASLIWRLVPDPAEPSGVTLNATQTTTDAQPERVDVANLHLFGQAGMALPLNTTFDAPETSLDLLLRGTLVSDDPKLGMAIVVDAEGDGFYNVGDELPGAAELHEVYTDRVVLVHQGRYETLRLRDEEAPPRRRQAAARRAAGTGGPAQPLPGIRTGNTPDTSAVDWKAVQTNLRIDPAELARQVRVLPHMENGKPVGVRLQAGRDSLLFSKLGLRNTDIITEVNGIPLDNPARSMALLTQLQGQSQFAVRLKRDGREMTLNIDANSLNR
ncbi:MAG: type II secretion system protein GspC [Pseudomonadota bacterium]